MADERPVTAQDWIPLWDGSSLDALRGYGRDGFPDGSWVVDGDALRTVPGHAVDLVTRETFEDFEVAFEWRLSPGGNSGVIYRVAETDGPAWHTGPEYQILDDSIHPDGGTPETSAGALYGLVAPEPGKRLEPVGAWNTGSIVVRAGRVEHWLNDVLVVRYDWDDPALRERIRASKFAEFDGFMRQPRGHIALQHHGEEAWLRNVRVRPLGEDGTR